MKLKIAPYFASLHVVLVALAVLVMMLARENRQLKRLSAPSAPAVALEIGQTIEPVRLRHLDGGEETLDFSGSGKDRLLLVFTTTCSACRANQTAWRALHERLGDSMDVLGISLSEAEETRGYRQLHDLPFPVALPADRERFAEAFAISAVPTTIRIGADSRVRGSWRGALSEDQLAEVCSIDHG